MDFPEGENKQTNEKCGLKTNSALIFIKFLVQKTSFKLVLIINFAL